jgi:FkbM family methyltransferase
VSTSTAPPAGAPARLLHWFCTRPYFKGKHRIEAVATRLTPLPEPTFSGTFADGFTMEFRADDVYERRVYYHNCELDTYAFLRDTLRPGMTFLDCGANLGFFTLLASRLVGPTGTVWAFEPTPDTYERLAAHVEANGCTNVHLHRAALGAAPGRAGVVALDSLSHAMNAVGVPDADRPTLAECDVLTVDALLATGVPSPDVMKVDVEGGELGVLRGAEELLRGPDCPVLIVELCRAHDARFGYEPEDIITFLRGLRPFEITWLDPRGRRTPVAPGEELPHYAVLGRHHDSNYIFTPT